MPQPAYFREDREVRASGGYSIDVPASGGASHRFEEGANQRRPYRAGLRYLLASNMLAVMMCLYLFGPCFVAAASVERINCSIASEPCGCNSSGSDLRCANESMPRGVNRRDADMCCCPHGGAIHLERRKCEMHGGV